MLTCNWTNCMSVGGTVEYIFSPEVATGQVEQALRLNLSFYHFSCSKGLLKSPHVFSYL